MMLRDWRSYPPLTLRRELLARGWDDRAISRAVRAGDLVRVRYGSYADGQLWRTLTSAEKYAARCHAVQRRAASELVLSHVSALPAYGAPLWGLDLDVVHGTRKDARAGRKEAGVHQHAGLLLPVDFAPVDGVDVTSAARTALEITTIAPVEPSLVVVNHLLHAGHVTLPELWARYGSTVTIERDRLGVVSPSATSMRRWPGSLRTELVLRLADARCESVAESRLLFLCWDRGLVMPVPQHEVRDTTGRIVARVDFAWPELGVFLEVDGRVKYTDLVPAGESAADVVLREKRREELVTELTGWRCIRVTWADLEHPERLVARIRAALNGRRRAS
ncbi:type IV toxin-antitoxin system AbiEi family antitoxin domain-containing protein [Nocardioides sp. IC4_145]|uniref:type IV toxin-antitoxin system AbiEi family antitoxin domain-containing protein n=1 Tax=Nocardioides sp. IC4_145 TaxID=2714037 RepID=UPI00140B8F03|nr:type IV toxin-antitoxin system AbiEi family antitoxin domain-containing protein [Nocardioides sp. IC4_145]NHC23309.1 type IV toxin-antitoxin system AbiEi family antitoxin domain-containing protein [Nocardioides sp. IC4_145]